MSGELLYRPVYGEDLLHSVGDDFALGLAKGPLVGTVGCIGVMGKVYQTLQRLWNETELKVSSKEELEESQLALYRFCFYGIYSFASLGVRPDEMLRITSSRRDYVQSLWKAMNPWVFWTKPRYDLPGEFAILNVTQLIGSVYDEVRDFSNRHELDEDWNGSELNAEYLADKRQWISDKLEALRGAGAAYSVEMLKVPRGGEYVFGRYSALDAAYLRAIDAIAAMIFISTKVLVKMDGDHDLEKYVLMAAKSLQS